MKDYCGWKKYFDENIWDTECGETWQTMVGTLKENGWNFCPKCGRKIKEVK